MNNLIIGDTSQLSFYFPENYQRISSRNINFEDFESSNYDRIYVCFSEQRTFIENDEKMFLDVNFKYTKKIIDFFSKKCNNLIFYSTSDLWNNYISSIDITIQYNYNYTPYIKSKELITNYIKENYNNVIILYPFNFNSPYRKSGFLFSKIFDSIINEKQIEIGNTYFYRDLIHPKYVVERSILCNTDEIIGSGRLIFVNDFIREIYKTFNLNYDIMVKENNIYNLSVKRNPIYLNSNNCLYEKLIEDTVYDIKKFKNPVS